jgi:hypothetical protein
MTKPRKSYAVIQWRVRSLWKALPASDKVWTTWNRVESTAAQRVLSALKKDRTFEFREKP